MTAAAALLVCGAGILTVAYAGDDPPGGGDPGGEPGGGQTCTISCDNGFEGSIHCPSGTSCCQDMACDVMVYAGTCCEAGEECDAGFDPDLDASVRCEAED